MVDETQLLDAGGRMAKEAGGKVLEQSGGFFGSLIKAPFALAGNVAKQAWGSMFSWWTPVTMALGALLVAAPDYIRKAGEATGRTDISDAIGENIGNSSTGGLLLKIAGTGLAASAGIGAVTGAAQSLIGSGPADSAPPSTGARIGQFAGTALTFAAIGAVALGAIKTDGIKLDTTGAKEVTPPPPPKSKSVTAEAVVN